MYKIDANPTFKRDVKFLVPVDGGFEENSISVIYKALDVDEISKFDQTNLADQKKYLIAVISEVGDVCDMAGKPLPYNHALRDRLINNASCRMAMIKEFEMAILGARTKN